MNLFKKSIQFAAIKSIANLFNCLPMGLNLWIGRCIGHLVYFFLSRKRRVVYANLKTVFSQTHSPSQIRRMTKEVSVNFFQSIIEFLCLPKIKRLGFEKFVTLEGKENIEQALSKGKGVIFLAVHSGSWELASIIGSLTNSTYHIVANEQPKMQSLAKMLDEYRTIVGAHVIKAGSATKEIIQALKANEIVSLVLDQGGRTGMVLPFLGKTASLSTGAIRLALKYGCAVCPVWIERQNNRRHLLRVFPAMDMSVSGDLKKDLRDNMLKATAFFEKTLREKPLEYMWFYKVFKYSTNKRIVIIDDGRTGHLRQSQSVSRHLTEILQKKGITVEENTVFFEWRNLWAAHLFSFYSFLAQYYPLLRNEDNLKLFLKNQSYNNLIKQKADFIISCGFQGAGINFILSQNHLAQSIGILTSGLLSKDHFKALVWPAHRKPFASKCTCIIRPKVSPNLINPSYLKEQGEGLIKHYSHLRGNMRLKFGVLIGGHAKGIKLNEKAIHELLSQIKQAAEHYNADILLTTSRRTPKPIEQLILRELKNFQRLGLCIIANQRNVPQAVGGILYLSDLVIVSGESISMVSEALSSKKRTIVFHPQGEYGVKPANKYEDFVLKLNDEGYLMISSVGNIKTTIAQLLGQKFKLKSLDDENIIKEGLARII
ncbi:MAG: mitochondrial fission ELM1 family protein [Candidatus Omnitrophica bacterium]|nr:mitochondrial fission ELM1 family protein [Candidatus Omnitrophota bacterium]